VTTLILARHGETDWNRDRRWQGHADPPLNAHGRRQALNLAELLADEPVDAIYSSDLRRAQETAQIIAERLVAPVVAMPELREIDVGEWSGLTTPEIEERFPTGVRRHREGGDGWERGETHAAMAARVVAAVMRIAEAHPAGHVVYVGHGGTIRALLARAEGLGLREFRVTRPAPGNGSVAAISVKDGMWRRLD
jgi:broad specificity phosphatase PhoE